MSFELPKDDALCHHTGFEKNCLGLVASGKCKRWRYLPGDDPFTGESRQNWGCIDDLVLYLQGEANRQADGSHAAVTQVREMIINPEYRRQQIAKSQDMKTIEDQTCKSPS